MGEYVHVPVMPDECIRGLDIKSDGIYLDGTAGLGGHSSLIAGKCGRLIALDRDEDAIEACRARLAPFGGKVTLVRSDFRDMTAVLDELGVEKLDGVLLDLGVSSLQLDKPERGFSYRYDAPLDMRMDGRGSLTADEIVNTWSKEALCRILYDYGEERYAPQIAAGIIRARPINGTARLAEVVISSMPGKGRREPQHPARRTFQALRIAVNDELEAVSQGVRAAIDRLATGGRICVLTFHSLEDRIVKRVFAEAAAGCKCPPAFPACVCGIKPVVRALPKAEPSAEEKKVNPRAASARLRVAEKL